MNKFDLEGFILLCCMAYLGNFILHSAVKLELAHSANHEPVVTYKNLAREFKND